MKGRQLGFGGAAAIGLVGAAAGASVVPGATSVTAFQGVTFSSQEEVKVLFLNQAIDVTAGVEWSASSDGGVDEQALLFGNATYDVVCSLFLNGELADQTTTAVAGSLPDALPCGQAMAYSNGRFELAVGVALSESGAIANAEDAQASLSLMGIQPGVTLLPLILLMVLALSTGMVEPSLFMGLWLGACIVEGSLGGGFQRLLNQYLYDALSDGGHVLVILFTVMLSGLVAMMERSGGMRGVANGLAKVANTPRLAQLSSLASGCLIFFDDYANCLVIGATMRPITDRMGISREKLAFIVDATAAPIASLVPISSWVGYEVGLIQDELDRVAAANGGTMPPSLTSSGFVAFLESIAFRYYPIFLLVLQIALILSQRDLGPMLVAERLCAVYGRTDGGKGAGAASKRIARDANTPRDDTPARAWNMLVPTGVLVALVFYILVRSGENGEPDQTFMDKIQGSDSYVALLEGSMASALIAGLFYAVQFKLDGKLSLPKPPASCMPSCCRSSSGTGSVPVPLLAPSESVESFLFGMTKVFPAIVVLTLAWAVAAVMADIGADRFFYAALADTPAGSMPTITFILSALLAFATGTSWGTMAIVFPLVIVPAAALSNNDPVIVYATIASVLSGAVAGDHVSPISDTTVLASLAAECDLTQHVKTQAPYVAIVSVWAVLVGTLPVGRAVYSTGVAILLGVLFLVVTVAALAAPVLAASGRFDPITELYMRCNPRSGLHKLKADVKAFAVHGDPLTDPEEEADQADGVGKVRQESAGNNVGGDDAKVTEPVAEESDAKDVTQV